MAKRAGRKRGAPNGSAARKQCRQGTSRARTRTPILRETPDCVRMLRGWLLLVARRQMAPAAIARPENSLGGKGPAFGSHARARCAVLCRESRAGGGTGVHTRQRLLPGTGFVAKLVRVQRAGLAAWQSLRALESCLPTRRYNSVHVVWVSLSPPARVLSTSRVGPLCRQRMNACNQCDACVYLDPTCVTWCPPPAGARSGGTCHGAPCAATFSLNYTQASCSPCAAFSLARCRRLCHRTRAVAKAARPSGRRRRR